MVEREITVQTTDGPMRAFLARPDGDGPFPVAVLYMDALGYRQQLKINARRFAADGYCVAVPDLYHGSGEHVTFDVTKLLEEHGAETVGPETARLRECMAKVTPSVVLEATKALFTELAADPAAQPGPKVSVGYCMGAACMLHALSRLPDEFVAGAGIHPSALATDAPDSPHLGVGSVRAELWFAFAEKDDMVSPESLSVLRDAMEHADVAGTVEEIPDTLHGYAMADLPVYHERAAERHYEGTLDLWHRNLAALTVV